MFFQQFKVEGLGCYSYLIGCPKAGVACVVDPERHVDRYIDTARENGMRITHIFDTHIHADHITGSRELARRTGAKIHVHHNAGAAYDHIPLRDGDRFKFGVANLEIIETPGHTPNSVTIAVSDTSRSKDPMLLLTGDLLFVGDIGRPDLAGEDLLEEQVKNLYDSLYAKLARFPDGVEVYPAHGAGSLCGKGISPKPMTTLGFERRYNPLLNKMPFEKFREIMTAEFQLRPPNFMAIVDKNRKGPGLLESDPPVRRLSVDEVETRRDGGAVIVDVRDATSFGAAFIPGSLNIGLKPQSPNWLGMVVDAKNDLVLVADSREDALKAVRMFRRVGYDRITGFLDGGVAEWAAAGKPLKHLPQLTAQSLSHVLEKYHDHVLIDVRTEHEWASGHIKRAIHKPVGDLVKEGIDIDDKKRHITAICGSGYRSNIAGSFLKSQGYEHVFSVIGGMTAWKNAQRLKVK
ncbi:MAG: rhodanese-like domain-containing protein [Candidatus Tritonobacter lacicola]|nr:rhodanese-like domain-containing protein [Candidatus Tritonobacter lacicola]